MKRIPFLVAAVIALALPAMAQETYSVSATANQVTTLSQIVAGFNQARCSAFGKSTNCTDTGASGTCVAAGAAGGSSCTAAQARAAGARIYPLTQAGREEYLSFEIAAPAFIFQKSQIPIATVQAYCIWWNAQNQTTKDAELTKIGYPTGQTNCPLQ